MPDPASEGVDVAGGVDFTAVAVVAAFAAVAVVAVGVTVDILYQRQGYKQHMSGTTYVVIGTTYVVIGTTYVVIGTRRNQDYARYTTMFHFVLHQ